MKNKEESSHGSTRGNPSSSEETTGSLSQPGRAVSAPRGTVGNVPETTDKGGFWNWLAGHPLAQPASEGG